MRVRYELDMDMPSDREELDLINARHKMADALNDIYEYVRNLKKHGDQKTICKYDLFDKVVTILNENEVYL